MSINRLGRITLAAVALASASALPMTEALAQVAGPRPGFATDRNHPGNRDRNALQIQPNMETRDSIASYARMIEFGECLSRISQSRAETVLSKEPLSPAGASPSAAKRAAI